MPRSSSVAHRGPAVRLRDLVAVRRQVLREHVAHGAIVVDDQHPARARLFRAHPRSLFSCSASATCSFLSAGFCEPSPAAPLTSPANFFCGDSAGVGEAFSSSPSPGDGDGISFSPSPGLGEGSASLVVPVIGTVLVLCFSAPGEGEGLRRVAAAVSFAVRFSA